MQLQLPDNVLSHSFCHLPFCRAAGRRSMGGGLGTGNLCNGGGNNTRAPDRPGFGRQSISTATGPGGDNEYALLAYGGAHNQVAADAESVSRNEADLDEESMPVYEDTQFLGRGGSGTVAGVDETSSFLLYEDTQFMSQPVGSPDRADPFAMATGSADNTAPLMMYEDTQFLPKFTDAG